MENFARPSEQERMWVNTETYAELTANVYWTNSDSIQPFCFKNCPRDISLKDIVLKRMK